jgi:hypothetical protein
MSGDHAKIADFQSILSMLTTADRRPELLETLEAKLNDKKTVKLIESAISLAEKMSPIEGLELGINSPSAAALVLRSLLGRKNK